MVNTPVKKRRIVTELLHSFSLIICCDGAPAKDCHGTHLLWCHTIMPYKQAVKVALLVKPALTCDFRKLQIGIINEIYAAF